ncbi:amidase [Paraglaciecola arctica]|uniref:amidase n=1 Tax=Paraglaciecola arctica TaxID=1128911 RepID=UPI001C066328|nr:amidase [Paraglaciecola arctica]MBU3003968.1 amidase [Paraglaciecola arctica]
MRCYLSLLLAVSLWCVAPSIYSADKADFSNLTLAKTQMLLKSGDATLAQLVDYYLGRIDKYDTNGNKINSVAQINPALKQQISILQNKLDTQQPLGNLFGAIVLLKDNIDANGMVNSAGSWLMREHHPKQDAFVVARLIAEDALILGKANLSEWANFRSSKSSSGWSSLHGQTLNPHDPTRSPCGSSAGSGAAIAADFALLAVGTETDGSVTCPAAVNGIVGIKPTLGLLSRSGIIPIAHSQDTAGPMTRTVTDSVIMLEAMMGKDPMDKAALSPISLSQYLKLGELKGKRIGVMRNMMGYHPELDQVFDQQLVVFEKAGAIIVDNANIETKGKWGEDEYTVLLAEFKADLNQYLTQSKAPLKSLEDAIAKNIEFSPRTMPVFSQEIFIAAQAAPNLNEKQYLDALANSKLLTGVQGIDATLAKHDVDFLIAPTTAPGWKIDHINGDNYMGSAGSASAVSGYPHITVPMGRVKHMPVNISFVGAKLSEAVLVQAAYEFEQLTQARLTPKL